MASKVKTISYDYFQVFCEKKADDKSIQETLYDLTGILKKAQTLPARDTTEDYRGEKARIQTVKYDDKDKIWEIQLLRLRENNPPGIADDDGQYEIIVLEDGKYVGEFSSALYDKNKCILVLHRNINSITPSGVEEYLNKIINNGNIRIKLKPIIKLKDINALMKNKIYRKITVGVSTEDLTTISKENHLLGLLNMISKYEGANVKLEISLGNVKRSRSLAPGLINETVDELLGNNITSKLQLRLKETPDTKTEKVDLLDHRVRDFDDYTLDRKTPLTHNQVYFNMKHSYLIRKKDNNIFKGD